MEKLTDEEYKKMYDDCPIHIKAYEEWDENGDPVVNKKKIIKYTVISQ